MGIELQNINVIINISTLIGMGVALRRISTIVTTFTNKIEYIERENKEIIMRIAQMETRYETKNENHEKNHNILSVSMARVEAKIDLIMGRNAKG